MGTPTYIKQVSCTWAQPGGHLPSNIDWLFIWKGTTCTSSSKGSSAIEIVGNKLPKHRFDSFAYPICLWFWIVPICYCYSSSSCVGHQFLISTVQWCCCENSRNFMWIFHIEKGFKGLTSECFTCFDSQNWNYNKDHADYILRD